MTIDTLITCLGAMLAGATTACVLLLRYWSVKDR